MNRLNTPAIRVFVSFCVITILTMFMWPRDSTELPHLAVFPWPPAGVTVTALLFAGIQFWPAVFLGVLLSGYPQYGIPGAVLAAFVTVGAISAAWFTRTYAGGVHAFERPRGMALFLLLAGAVSSAFGAFGIVLSRLLAGLPVEPIAPVFVDVWLGNAAGIMIGVPLLVTWWLHPKLAIRRRKLAEFMLLFVVTAGLLRLIAFSSAPHPYLLVLPALWAALSFDIRETVTVLFLTAVALIRVTGWGTGPFVGSEMDPTILPGLPLFLVVLSGTKLIIASLVSDRLRTYRAMHLREKFYKSLIERSMDAICLLDPSSNISYASPAVMPMLGYRPEELVGKSGLEFIHPDDRKVAGTNLYGLVTNPDKTTTHSYRIRTKSGSFKWVEITGKSLLAEEAVRAIVINFRDISERRRLDEAKQEFFMIAAHQLRAPLTSVRWHLESVLTEQDIPAAFRGKLKQVYEGTHTMIRTVNEILDVTRIIEGGLVAVPKPTDVTGQIRQLVEREGAMVRQQNNRVTVDSPDPRPIAMVDPKYSMAVFENILSNAVKYTSNGTVTVTVGTSDHTVIVTVSDTGIGIPKEEQEQLFGKFYRATNAQRVDAQGAGLGLFIAKSYVDTWGGTISVISPTIGAIGTAVRITMPAAYTITNGPSLKGGT